MLIERNTVRHELARDLFTTSEAANLSAWAVVAEFDDTELSRRLYRSLSTNNALS